MQSIHRGSCTCRKGVCADSATIPLGVLAMDANISFVGLPSCRTLKIGAKYIMCGHGTPLWR